MIDNELLVAFALFAAVTLFTPGPNNLMLMTSGLNWGVTRTLPHLLGVCLGFAFMVALVGLGLGRAFETWPWLYTILKWGGALYLLHLAWHIAVAGPVGDDGAASGRPMTFLGAALFQWVNPKAWVMAVGAVSAYGAIAGFPWNVTIMAGTFLGLGFLSSGTWVVFGQQLRRLITSPRWVRVFNVAMAGLLVASLIPLARG